MERCNDDVFERGESLGLFDMSKEEAEEKCKYLTKETGELHDWHYIAGRVHIKVLRKVEGTVATVDDKVGSWS